MAESPELVGVGVKLHHAEDGQFSLAFKYTFDTQASTSEHVLSMAPAATAPAPAPPARRSSRSGSAAAVATAPPERKVSVTIDGAPTDLRLVDDVPLLAFINGRSGGQQGAAAKAALLEELGPAQVFDLGRVRTSDWRPEHALRQFGGVPGLRILVCGGDGTCGWLLSAMDAAGVRVPMAVMPLGTGNDLARVLRWGAGFTRAMGRRPYLERVAAATPHELDRWTVRLQLPGSDAAASTDSLKLPPTMSRDAAGGWSGVFCNYVALGIEAGGLHAFHAKRESKPHLFNSRMKNQVMMVTLAAPRTGLFGCCCPQPQLAPIVRAWGKFPPESGRGGDADGDGWVPLTLPARCKSLLLLNIPSHSAGGNPWAPGPPGKGDLRPQSISDGARPTRDTSPRHRPHATRPPLSLTRPISLQASSR